MSVELDFIKEKGLTEEFNAYQQEWKKKEDALKVDYKWNITYMLGDGDDDIEDEFALTAKERDELIKYFEALPPDLQIAVIKDEYEWQQSTIIHSLQILKMLNGEKICSLDEFSSYNDSITSKMRKIKAIKPMNEMTTDKYEKLEANNFKYITYGDCFSDMFYYIYNIHVRNWIKNGAKPEDVEFKLDFRFYP